MVRRRIGVTVEEDLIKWVDDQVEAKRFRNRSHAVEYALAKLKDSGL